MSNVFLQDPKQTWSDGGNKETDARYDVDIFNENMIPMWLMSSYRPPRQRMKDKEQ